MISRPWRGSSRRVNWLLLAWDDVEVTDKLRLTVAVSVDAGTETDGEEEGIVVWARKVTPKAYIYQHFFILFEFFQGLDDVDWLHDTSDFEALNEFLNDMKWLYFILVLESHYICTLFWEMGDTLQKIFLVVS